MEKTLFHVSGKSTMSDSAWQLDVGPTESGNNIISNNELRNLWGAGLKIIAMDVSNQLFKPIRYIWTHTGKFPGEFLLIPM